MIPPTGGRSTGEAPASLARDLRRSIGDFVRAIRQGAGTTRTAQSETLDLLHRLGAANVATLAEKRGVTHQTMRLVVAQLEGAGHVQQQADPADRRSRIVSISAAGCTALAREQEARADQIEDMIRGRLSPEEQKLLRSAISLLDRLAAPPNQGSACVPECHSGA